MTQVTDTPIPAEIIHLDFDAETRTEEKPEEPVLCHMEKCRVGGVGRYTCLRPAHWLVSLDMADLCGHGAKVHVCDECWGEVQRDPSKTWLCQEGCDKSFVVMAHLTGLVRIK